ncbi:MAG TPA: AMP-binding protein [Candidatus Dormibacteraeota bacterium]|nr:AMP-binding protein [Candidatus Dormibacteraeota bacterium]
MPRPNLISLFDSFLCHGEDVAVIERRGYRRETLTYAELHRAALVWCEVLAGRGIGPGDRVLLWGPNSGAWIACFWGILLRGAIAVPMDAAASLDFVQRTTASAGVKLILRNASQPELLPGGPPWVVYSESRNQGRAPATPPDMQTAQDQAAVRTTVAEILFTSGTTSEPRGVVLTHGNFLANLEPLERGIDVYRKYERWFHPLRFVSLVPLSHVFGQFMTLFVPPLLGAAVVFESSNHPAEIMRTIKRERAAALIAVPRMLDALRSGLERDLDASKQTPWFRRAYAEAGGEKFLRRVWRFRRIHRRFGWKFWAFISGGAALSSDTEDFFRRMGYAVVQGYGMTETASLISLNHPFRAAQGSVGKVLPGREFQLAEDGEILLRGENVSAGYWEAGEVRPAGEHGWLRTGDIGEVDSEGNLRFRGRKKNVIVTPAGLNVYPEDLEKALRRQPGVRDCVALPRERHGNAEPCAVLLVEDPASQTADAAVEAANKSLAEYQRVHEWLVWPEADFPRTATGKPKLAEIRARTEAMWDGAVGGVASAGWASPAPTRGNVPLDALIAQVSGRNAAEGAHLEQKLGLSSLDRVELLSALEERFHVELNETSFAEAESVADVQRLLRQPSVQYSVQRSEHAYPRWAQRTVTRWARLLVYYTLVWPATQILGHPRILGREHLRGLRGPVLVVSNHITRRADIGLILAALPRGFRHRLAIAMGGEALQEMGYPPRDWFFLRRWSYGLGYWLVTALFNVFPLPQFSGFRESFRFAGESVDRGYSVLIFPEGVVNDTTTGEMAPFQSGIGLLAQNLGIPIVPVRLDGVWQMKRQRRRLAHLGEITVNIGAPISFSQETPPEEIARQLEATVAAL